MGPEGETVSAGDCTRQTLWVRHTEELEGDREGGAGRGEGVEQAQSDVFMDGKRLGVAISQQRACLRCTNS